MNALTSPSNDSFAALLPRELRDYAATMSWTTFTRRFFAPNGPIRLGSWARAGGRGGRTTFDATFGIGDSIHSATATAYGPIDALTSMLYDAGFHLEIISFHQQPLGDGTTATFVRCEFDGRQEWAIAIESDSAESAVRALVSAANMLHG